jgi:hypothetical protein
VPWGLAGKPLQQLMLRSVIQVQLMRENLAQPGCDKYALNISKSGCNAGKPCAFDNIARRIIGVTMRAFSRL